MSRKNENKSIFELENRIDELEIIINQLNKEKADSQELFRTQKENLEKLQAIYDNSSAGIEIFDHDGVLIHGNKKSFEMFGVKPEDVINKFNIKDDPNYQFPEIWKKLDQGIEVSSSLVFSFDKISYTSTKKGIRHYFITTTPFKQYSETIGYLIQIIDITEQRKKMINEITSMVTNAFSNNNDKLIDFIKQIESSMDVASLANEFPSLAKEVRNEFISIISSRFPSLTPAELRIIGLLKLNLNSKQISITLGRSIRTIENTRLNIRKKMKLDNKISLSSFLKSIS